MEERQEIRLVPRGRYIGVLGKMLTCYALACFTVTIGGAFVLLGGWYLLMRLSALLYLPIRFAFSVGELCVFLITLAGAALVFTGVQLFKKAQATEAIAPITRHNTHLLPAQESLVRASDLPQSPQEVLLRAAPNGRETPQEELLRAHQPPR